MSQIDGENGEQWRYHADKYLLSLRLFSLLTGWLTFYARFQVYSQGFFQILERSIAQRLYRCNIQGNTDFTFYFPCVTFQGKR